ncbi:thioredoxin domain-containing protein [Tupanvirus deep ocean]|uniref:Thioredoxin domain-containing protein n=2 Tax=Tupanvirus TaxID=2094720 RepID=A0AC62A7Z3_9VIRU|nr:thioredoxin domain-containing protein [Tupanvirus deep ocean]QKU33901.1 thioredoxin domain-containing protein [Tupanvirus deep ocean]
MSEIAHRNMNVHTNKITSMRNKFAGICNANNEKTALDILMQMRLIHGCAIYDDAVEKHTILTKGIDNITDDEFIKLSTNASLLHVIHNHIRYCEKLLYKCKKQSGSINPIQITSDSEMQSATQSVSRGKESSFENAMETKNKTNALSTNISKNNNKVVPIINRVSANTEELSLKNIETETSNQLGIESDSLGPLQPQDLFDMEDQSAITIRKIPSGTTQTNITTNKNLKTIPTSNISANKNLNANVTANTTGTTANSTTNVLTGGVRETNDSNMNTSDYINNLTSTEAERLASDYKKTQNFDTNTKSNSSKNYDKSIQTFTNFKVDKPTLINYWADWCGPSKAFKPNWDKFVNTYKNKFQDLQVTDLNVKTDDKLNKLASAAGVKGYPTLVLFYNGSKYHKVASGMTVDDINNFITNTMQSSQK